MFIIVYPIIYNGFFASIPGGLALTFLNHQPFSPGEAARWWAWSIRLPRAVGFQATDDMPTMDDENDGKPLKKMGWCGENPRFLETPMWFT